MNDHIRIENKKAGSGRLESMMNADKGYFFTLIEQPIALV